MKALLSFAVIILICSNTSFAQGFNDKPTENFNIEVFKNFKDTVRSQALSRGNEGGHGGDGYVLEFVTLGKLISAGFDSFSVETLKQNHFTKEAFEQAVKLVKVTSHPKEEMLLEGEEVDAINFPAKNQIKMNRDRWRELSLEGRIKLVMHEYFGILGVERDSYQVSLKFVSFAQMLSKEVASSPDYKNLSVNLFYGQCNIFPPLTSSQICDSSSKEMADAQECSKRKAQAKCAIAEKADCKIIDTTMNSVLSTRYVGMRYCEVLTIAK